MIMVSGVFNICEQYATNGRSCGNETFKFKFGLIELGQEINGYLTMNITLA